MRNLHTWRSRNSRAARVGSGDLGLLIRDLDRDDSVLGASGREVEGWRSSCVALWLWNAKF